MSSACGTKVQQQTFEMNKLGIIHRHRWKKGLKISKIAKVAYDPSFHWGPQIFPNWYMERSIMLIHGQRLTKAQWSSAFHNGTGFVQLRTNKFQGLFKDFSRTNYSFQRLRFLNKLASDPIG